MSVLLPQAIINEWAHNTFVKWCLKIRLLCCWQNGPYKSKAEIFDKLNSKLTPTMKVTLEKYASNLVALRATKWCCLCTNTSASEGELRRAQIA